MMLNLRRLVTNVSWVLNSASTPHTSSIQPASSPILRTCYGYALSSQFSSQSYDSQSLNIDFSNKESKRRLFNRFDSGISWPFRISPPFYRMRSSIFCFYDRVDMLIYFAFQLMCRLVYRSKQRGFLELDLVLGKWVEENINSLDEKRIKDLIHVLDMENPDLWRWVSGQEQPPEAVNSNPVFAAVREGVKKSLDSHAAPETRATPGQPWVRGWDDIKKGRDGPVAGNQ